MVEANARRCPPRPSSMTASSRWWPAVGRTSTSPPWGCLRPSMLALTTAAPSTPRPKLACRGKSEGRHLGLV
jgi:hypothetical protein